MNRLRLLRNAKLTLETSCRAKAGESLLILADEIMHPYADGIAAAARELGLLPLVMDIRAYLASPAYQTGAVSKPLLAAMEAADIVLENLADTWVTNRPDFGRLSGNPHRQDESLTGERRWLILQCRGLDEWEIEPEKLMRIRRRTLWLLNLLRRAKSGRITTSAGTDFTFGLGGQAVATPILGIVPLYGEVAVTPDLASTFGSFVADGPTQRGVRPATELEHPPFKVTVRAGRVQHITPGEEHQMRRLHDFIASGTPAADAIDEIGLVTTDLPENDRFYWSDGTHHHDRSHIALGNNDRRDKLVHGAKHMDCEVSRPTIYIDDMLVYENGIFNDQLIQ